MTTLREDITGTALGRNGGSWVAGLTANWATNIGSAAFDLLLSLVEPGVAGLSAGDGCVSMTYHADVITVCG
jgi:hypothetical protein